MSTQWLVVVHWIDYGGHCGGWKILNATNLRGYFLKFIAVWTKWHQTSWLTMNDGTYSLLYVCTANSIGLIHFHSKYNVLQVDDVTFHIGIGALPVVEGSFPFFYRSNTLASHRTSSSIRTHRTVVASEIGRLRDPSLVAYKGWMWSYEKLLPLSKSRLHWNENDWLRVKGVMVRQSGDRAEERPETWMGDDLVSQQSEGQSSDAHVRLSTQL